MKYRLFLVVVSLIFFIPDMCYTKGAGVNAVGILKLEPGSRPAALGGAYSAVTDDIYGVWYNPSSLSYIAGRTVTFMHQELFQDVSQEVLGGNFCINGTHISFWLNYLDYGDAAHTVYDESGGSVELDEFGSEERMFMMTVSSFLSKNISTGLGLKVLDSKLADKRASALAFDIGLLYQPYNKNYSIGMAVQNIGSKIKYYTERENLPETIRFGINLNMIRKFLNVNFDIEHQNQSEFEYMLGSELRLNKYLFVRTGVNSKIEAGSSLTGGIGLKYRKFTLDYGYIPYGDLGSTHRININYVLKPVVLGQGQRISFLTRLFKKSGEKPKSEEISSRKPGKEKSLSEPEIKQVAVKTGSQKQTFDKKTAAAEKVSEPAKKGIDENLLNELKEANKAKDEQIAELFNEKESLKKRVTNLEKTIKKIEKTGKKSKKSKDYSQQYIFLLLGSIMYLTK